MAKLQNAEKLTGGNYFPDVFSLAFSAFVFLGTCLPRSVGHAWSDCLSLFNLRNMVHDQLTLACFQRARVQARRKLNRKNSFIWLAISIFSTNLEQFRQKRVMMVRTSSVALIAMMVFKGQKRGGFR